MAPPFGNVTGSVTGYDTGYVAENGRRRFIPHVRRAETGAAGSLVSDGGKTFAAGEVRESC